MTNKKTTIDKSLQKRENERKKKSSKPVTSIELVRIQCREFSRKEAKAKVLSIRILQVKETCRNRQRDERERDIQKGKHKDINGLGHTHIRTRAVSFPGVAMRYIRMAALSTGHGTRNEIAGGREKQTWLLRLH